MKRPGNEEPKRVRYRKMMENKDPQIRKTFFQKCGFPPIHVVTQS